MKYMKFSKTTSVTGLASAAAVLLGVTSAQAQITFSVDTNSSQAGGVVDASAQFTYSSTADTLTVVLMNLESGSTSQGQALSGVIFNGLTSYSSLTGTGQEITIASDGSYTMGTDSPGDITQNSGGNYWSDGGKFGLTALTATKPDYMIIGAPGGTDYTLNGNGNGFSGFDPYVYESATFVFSNATLNAITSCEFEFGTGPDATIPGTQTYTPVPETSTIVAGALMLLPLSVGAIRAIRKEKGTVPVKIS